MAEIVRAGMISVDEGQTDAAQSLGMTRLQTMRRIVLPQAMRVIIPPTGNETISMLKTTSLAERRSRVAELLYAVEQIYAGQLQNDPAADRREHLVPRDARASCTSGSTTSSATTAAARTRRRRRLQRIRDGVLSLGEAAVSQPMVKAEGRPQALRRATRC